ncbi:MAG: Terminase-like family protein [Candidatus Methanofastidiosum methylothiophilum]|uniref:Terminase-like family protein n=1 Tax=Candidatus Methanofastidiosum methylothiophilum TaxID=1705564 RepID=A0A150J993_9EURY|nr:MAG: Terminase-like family protein [Candidatus Methanofastidiosum methylthiophilus]KYC53534.1 MAG: Terminase-like family protein [Candidatus Methanofastidiosum methylthiophilus]
MKRRVYLKLFPKQTKFVYSEALETLFLGGVGSGKTHAGGVRTLLMALRFPDEPGLIVANTYAQLRHSTLPPFFKVLELIGLDYHWSESKKEIAIYAGKKIIVRTYSLDKPGRVRGQTVPWIWVDEARDMSLDSYEELLKRCRGEREYLPISITTSPPELPHWLFDLFEGKCDGVNKFMIRVKTKENLFLSKTYVDRLTSTLSADKAAQELMAEWGIRGEKTFPYWGNDNITDYVYNETLPVFVTIDFGYRRPAIIVTQVPTFDLYEPEINIVDAWLPENKTTSDICYWLEKYKGKIAEFFGDPAGDSVNEMTHFTAVEEIKNKFPGVRFRYPTTPKQRSKPNGTEVLRRLILNAKGYRSLRISRDLVNKKPGEYTSVYMALKNLVYPKLETGRLDEKYFKDGTNDHPVDALRYQMVMQFYREN